MNPTKIWAWNHLKTLLYKHFPVLSSFMTYDRYFVIRLTRRVPLVEQELLTLQEHLVHPQILVGFMFFDLFYVYVL
jgi:hypothetical protein